MIHPTPALSSTAVATIEALLEDAVDRGIPVSFDINHRSRLWSATEARPVYVKIAGCATIVFAREGEARLLVPDAPLDVAGLAEAVVAGYLSVLLEGGEVAERLARDVRAGAAACTHPGDWGGFPTLSELQQLEAREPVVR